MFYLGREKGSKFCEDQFWTNLNFVEDTLLIRPIWFIEANGLAMAKSVHWLSEVDHVNKDVVKTCLQCLLWLQERWIFQNPLWFFQKSRDVFPIDCQHQTLLDWDGRRIESSSSISREYHHYPLPSSASLIGADGEFSFISYNPPWEQRPGLGEWEIRIDFKWIFYVWSTRFEWTAIVGLLLHFRFIPIPTLEYVMTIWHNHDTFIYM